MLLPPREEPSQGRLTHAEDSVISEAALSAAKTGQLNLGHLKHNAVLDDIVVQVKGFNLQLDLFAAEIGGYPVVEVGGNVFPVDVIGSAGLGGDDDLDELARSGRSRKKLVGDVLRELEQQNLSAGLSQPDEVRSWFSDGLKKFVSRRIEATRGIFGGGKEIGTRSNPGLNVRVISRTHGIRILYSPALFFNASNAFGNSLASPVESYLAPGIYLFGGIGAPLGGTRWDGVQEHIPPNSVINTVNL